MVKKTAKTFDVECYRNYFLIIIREMSTGMVWRWEIFNNNRIGHYSIDDLVQLMESSTMISFNGLSYDKAMVEGFVAEYNNQQLFDLSQYMIGTEMAAWNYSDHFAVDPIRYRHIDVFPVAPLKASLKIYGGRLGTRLLQDLPVDWEASITPEERKIMVDYCVNDNVVTRNIFMELRDQIRLRKALSKEYGIDLLSKSDAQIAEGVIKVEMGKRGVEARSKQLRTKKYYTYEAPGYVAFNDDRLKSVLDTVVSEKYSLSEKGSVLLPPAVRKTITYRGKKYQFGIGGLHSKESAVYYEDSDYLYIDYDVTSYYPSIILTNRYYPETLTEKFLDAYEDIVTRRVAAKKAGDKTVADSLKIVINSSFGKFGNRYSSMYDPKLLIQTTITGQLSLMMLVEMFEEEGIEVISANTDGVMVKVINDKENLSLADDIARRWEFETDMFLEDEPYVSVYKESVNSYFAVTKAGKIKKKGSTYGDPSLQKNPNCQVCANAVIKYLTEGVPFEKTVREDRDIRNFVVLRTVKGGAILDDVLLGKSVRWYYGKDKVEPIRYAKNGNKVPLSEGAVVINNLPSKFPSDVDYAAYNQRCLTMCENLGYNVI